MSRCIGASCINLICKTFIYLTSTQSNTTRTATCDCDFGSYGFAGLFASLAKRPKCQTDLSPRLHGILEACHKAKSVAVGKHR
jgi:hypothetical protein